MKGIIVKGKLILYSGPSGVGKGTLREIFSKNKDLNLGFSISYTTRTQRLNEVDKKDYFFVSEEVFSEMIAKNDLIEWVEFAGNKYGTSRAYVDSLLTKGKNVILEIETIGAMRILELYPDCLSIFLLPPSLEILESRLKQRATETPELIKKRLIKAKDEMGYQEKYNYAVVNGDALSAAKEIENIILKEINKES